VEPDVPKEYGVYVGLEYVKHIYDLKLGIDKLNTNLEVWVEMDKPKVQHKHQVSGQWQNLIMTRQDGGGLDQGMLFQFRRYLGLYCLFGT
jgi:hypothetical protein